MKNYLFIMAAASALLAVPVAADNCILSSENTSLVITANKGSEQH